MRALTTPAGVAAAPPAREPRPAPPPLPALPGPDGLLRCPWAATGPPDYRAYHDAEWGAPVRDEQGLYERIALESFQAGLSWLTVLRKREGLRAGFDGFDPQVVARYGEDEVERLLADPGVIRSRAKVRAAVTGARAVLALRADRPGGLPALVAELAGRAPDGPAPVTTADVPASTPASAALARGLKAAGFVHVGPVTAYALLQACGYVDDHLAGCRWRAVAGPHPR